MTLDWKDMGWTADEVQITSNSEYDFTGGKYAVDTYKTSQSYTLDFNIKQGGDPFIEEAWTLHGLKSYYEAQMNCQTYVIAFTNPMLGKKKDIKCSISAEIACNIPGEQIKELITKQAESLMTPHEVKEFRIWSNSAGNWIAFDLKKPFEGGGSIQYHTTGPVYSFAVGDFYYTTKQSAQLISGSSAEFLANELPGVSEIVKHPTHNELWTIRSIIIDLNDRQKWSREQIADWLETLEVDITFKVDTGAQLPSQPGEQ